MVVGQFDFFSNSAPMATTGQSLKAPQGVALNAIGDLFVADTGANRVLVFANPCTMFSSSGQQNGFTAKRVFGQDGSFTLNTCSAPSAQSLCAPEGIAIDSNESLFVGDVGNNRVLGYFGAAADGTDTIADVVFGQNGDFSTGICNIGGLTTPNLSLCFGARVSFIGVAVDTNDNLFVADAGNLRVVEYPGPFGPALPDNAVASLVLSGAASYSGLATDAASNLYVGTSNDVTEYDNPGVSGNTLAALTVGPSLSPAGVLGATPLATISGLAVDNKFRLFATDPNNNRIVVFSESATPSNSSKVNLVLGQPDFFEVQANLEDAERWPHQVRWQLIVALPQITSM